jgi:hypothetical protein
MSPPDLRQYHHPKSWVGSVLVDAWPLGSAFICQGEKTCLNLSAPNTCFFSSVGGSLSVLAKYILYHDLYIFSLQPSHQDPQGLYPLLGNRAPQVLGYHPFPIALVHPHHWCHQYHQAPSDNHHHHRDQMTSSAHPARTSAPRADPFYSVPTIFKFECPKGSSTITTYQLHQTNVHAALIGKRPLWVIHELIPTKINLHFPVPVSKYMVPPTHRQFFNFIIYFHL